VSRVVNHAPPSAAPLRSEQLELLRMLAYSYQRHGQSARAAVLWSALHALSPSNAFTAKSLAHALLRSARPEQALALLDRLMDAGDASALTHLLRSQALVMTGRLAEAARSMRFYVAARSEHKPMKGT